MIDRSPLKWDASPTESNYKKVFATQSREGGWRKRGPPLVAGCIWRLHERFCGRYARTTGAACFEGQAPPAAGAASLPTRKMVAGRTRSWQQNGLGLRSVSARA